MSPESAAAVGPGDVWRSTLDRYLHGGAAVSSSPAPGRTPLALQFELRELTPRSGFGWNGPTSRPAGRAGAPGSSDAAPGRPGEYRLGVRPVIRSTRGWARNGMTWSNLPHLLNRLDLDPEQHRWFCQFAAVHRAAGPPVPGQDAGWVFLDEFVNPVLWTMFGQAESLGVPFVGASAGVRVRLASTATLRLDATRAAGGIRLAPLLAIDGEPIPLRDARPIGDHGVYAFDLAKPHRFVLAPAPEPLGPEQLELLRARGAIREGLEVPDGAVEEFLADYLPELRDRIEVGSTDASVPLPDPPPPLLVLEATFAARHTLHLAWRWEEHRRRGPVPELGRVLPEGLLPEAWWPTAAAVGVAPAPATLRGVEAAEFASGVLPILEGIDGLRVETSGPRPDYRELTGEPRLTVTAVPSERHDWFDLGVLVTVGGHTVPFVPLFTALAKGRRKLLLVDGTFLSLANPALARLKELIEEARALDEWETGLVISRSQTSLWSDFEDLADEAVPALEWRALLAAVDDAPRAVAPPRGLRAELRPYQAEGLDRLVFLWRHRLGGILADDMGLGKTLQCLGLVQHLAEEHAAVPGAAPAVPRPGETDAVARQTDTRRPFLVIAPTSVVSNWAAEAARFTPGLVVRVIGSTEAAGPSTIAEAAADADLVVTSYALLRLDAEAHRAVARAGGYAGLILDEAQFVKNPGSRVHEVARELDIPFKLAVTGTPMENTLGDLHALLAIVAPGLFPSARRFTEEYVRPIERALPGISKGRGAGAASEVAEQLRAERLGRLRRRIRPFLLRRTKETVAAELPPKQEQTLTVELAPSHRALYEVTLQRERQKLFGLLDDLDRNRFIVFRSLTLLRLLALDASLIDEANRSIPSSKLDVLVEQLAEVLAEGHRALVFSQFTSYLELVAARLEAGGIRAALLDGRTRRRDAVIASFREGDAPVFLISLKAGGFGLNLTEADYVFLLDPWWNPASEQQAIDRAHRIGQHRNVMVYRLIAADTIEEKVMELSARKAALFDAAIDDDGLFGSALGADDIRGLLS